jgi:2-keto-4-pentenoate hydratase
VALAVDIADPRLSGAASMADRVADNGGAGCFVVGPWRAITGSFADRELLLEDGAASAAALFVDPVEQALELLRRCQADRETVAEGSVLLIVPDVAPLAIARGTSLVLAAGEIGTLSAEISG